MKPCEVLLVDHDLVVRKDTIMWDGVDLPRRVISSGRTAHPRSWMLVYVDVDGQHALSVHVEAAALAARDSGPLVDALVMAKHLPTMAPLGESTGVTLRRPRRPVQRGEVAVLASDYVPPPTKSLTRVVRWLEDNGHRATHATPGIGLVTITRTAVGDATQQAHQILRLFEKVGVKFEPEKFQLEWSPVDGIARLRIQLLDDDLPAGLGVPE